MMGLYPKHYGGHCGCTEKNSRIYLRNGSKLNHRSRGAAEWGKWGISFGQHWIIRILLQLPGDVFSELHFLMQISNSCWLYRLFIIPAKFQPINLSIKLIVSAHDWEKIFTVHSPNAHGSVAIVIEFSY